MFGSYKCDELDAFIMARQDCEKLKFTAKSKITKKGKLSIRQEEQDSNSL
jgi:hypothetical protein